MSLLLECYYGKALPINGRGSPLHGETLGFAHLGNRLTDGDDVVFPRPYFTLRNILGTPPGWVDPRAHNEAGRNKITCFM
jgi:hypothetical protein